MFFKKSAQTQFLDRLKAAPVVQEAMREIEANELADRQALIAEMAALGTTLRTFTTMRSKREAEINAEILLVEKRRNELGLELNDLDATGSRIRSTNNRELAALKAQIKAGADPRINNFEMWAHYAYRLASDQVGMNGSHHKLFMVEQGSEKRVALDHRLQSESLVRLGHMVMDSVARADAMRLEAALPADVMLELESMAAAIRIEYSSQPKTQALQADFLARIPGVMVMEVNDINEAVQ
ncbi:hypothetical protein [Variovorax boronicumulans]|uniref:hypothetical protein n=1 Tax=Variovorax boronicumulans TaxID=436515 RepID=UPI0033910236